MQHTQPTLQYTPRHSGLLCTAKITINDATVTENAINDTIIIVPRLAGNFPLMTQYCPCKYRL